jgi:MFS transporter, MHS family, proline/betaine transporter
MTKKSFLIVILSALVQYYDYHLFGFIAAKISLLFFPSASNLESLSKTYFVIFVSYLTKPLGAILLGHIGDLKGKSYSLNISLSITALCSLAIAIMPVYDKAGMLSIYGLMLVRMLISGFVAPGTDGIRLYIFEHINPKRQCLGEGMATASCLLGSFVAAASASFFTSSDAPSYGWRIAFLIGSIMGVFMLILKYFFPIEEYKTHKKPHMERGHGGKIGSILVDNWKIFLLSAIIAGGIGSSYQFLTIFWSQYNSSILGLISKDIISKYVPIAIVLFMVGSICAGLLADYIGKFYTIILASVGLLIMILIHFYLLINVHFNVIAYAMLGFVLPFLITPSHIILKQSVPLAIRYRIYSLAHAVGSICISAPTSFLSSKLYENSNILWLPLCYFVGVIIAMIFSVILLSKNTKLSS